MAVSSGRNKTMVDNLSKNPEILPQECPDCKGFTLFFGDEYKCRDCGKVIATYDKETRTWTLCQKK